MTARTSVLLVFSVLASSGFAQDFDQKITLSGSAMSAKKLLTELSKQANYTFETSPQTAKEVLLVQVKDVPLGELMKKIAEASGAEWAKETNIYRLVRGAGLSQSQARADLTARAQQLQEVLNKQFATLDKTPNFTQSDADALFKERTEGRPGPNGTRFFGAGGESNPAARSLLRFLRNIPAADLAAMPAGSRMVYSSYTTRMQRPLRGNTQQILSQFIAEQNVFASASANQPTQAPFSVGNVVTFPGMEIPKPIAGRIGKALLIVNRMASDPSFSIELKIYDDTGKVLATGSRFIAAAGVDPVATPSAGSEKPLTLSEQSKQFAKLFSDPQAATGGAPRMMFAFGGGTGEVSIGGPQGDGPQVPAEWREKIISPDVHEPLSFVVGELFAGTAEQKGTNLVANLPDSILFPLVRRVATGTLTPTQLLAIGKSQMGLTITEKDGWTVVSAQYPSEAYASRIDRVALGNLLRSASKSGYARLDDLAAYAMKQPDTIGLMLFDERYLNMVATEASIGGLLSGGLDRRLMLRLYGTMNVMQKQALGATNRIPLSGLSTQQLSIAQRLVFDSMTGPQISLPPEPGQQQREERIQQVVSGGGSSPMVQTFRSNEGLLHERTEALPNGIPNDGLLTVQVNSQAAVLASRATGGGSRIFTAGDLGGHQAVRTSPNLAAMTGSEADFDRYRAGNVVTYSFSFLLSPQATLARSLRDLILPAGAQTVAYDQLPAAFRTQVEQMRDRMVSQLKGIQMEPGGGISIGRRGDGGGNGPPPLP